jgi:hypothetical protein
MMFLRVLVLLGIALPQIALAQRATFERYRKRVTTSADSVLLVETQAAGLLPKPDSRGGSTFAREISVIMAVSGSTMKKKLDDFDAIDPPSGFGRVHSEMVSALTSLVTATSDLARVMDYASCRTEYKAGMDCDPNRRGEAAAQIMIGAGGAMETAAGDYLDARHRLQIMLKEKGVNLPALKESGRVKADATH